MAADGVKLAKPMKREITAERWRDTQLAKTVQALVDAKIDFIQLRDKALSDRQLVAAGRVILELTRETQTGFIMNDRADIAVACGADGVHVGQDELSVADTRQIVGPHKLDWSFNPFTGTSPSGGLARRGLHRSRTGVCVTDKILFAASRPGARQRNLRRN